jgi:hypothetical protein
MCIEFFRTRSQVLREMPELTIGILPAHETLAVPGCDAGDKRCEWERFRMMAVGATAITIDGVLVPTEQSQDKLFRPNLAEADFGGLTLIL